MLIVLICLAATTTAFFLPPDQKPFHRGALFCTPPTQPMENSAAQKALGFGAPPPAPTADELAARGKRSAQKAKYRAAIKLAKKSASLHKIVGAGPGDEKIDTRTAKNCGGAY